MSSFWSRTKRRAVAVLAAGAASAATAYCVYTWYTSSLTEPSPPSQEDQEERASLTAAATAKQVATNQFEEIDQDTFDSITPDNEEGLPSTSRSHRERSHQLHQQQQPPVLINPTSSTTTAALDAAAHLQHHFDSIQQIADATTLPSLLPALSRALAAADGIDASLERLRLAKAGTVPLSPEEKQKLWNDLSGAALARLTAAIWSLSLLSLQVRVQLNVLGRHLYLEAALHDPSSGGVGSLLGGGRGSNRFGAPKPPPQLSAPSQESFLSFSEYLTNVGHVKLLAIARKAADSALVGVSLDQEINSEELGHILSRALALFTQEIIGGSSSFVAAGGSSSSSLFTPQVGGWIEFLLPPPQELREILRVKKPDDRAMLPGAHEFLVDVDAVHAMVEEVGCILSSERFQHVAVLAARHASKLTAAGMEERLGQGIALPLARLVPLIIAESKSTLSARGEAAVAIATIPEVAALCATVYSCGPPL